MIVMMNYVLCEAVYLMSKQLNQLQYRSIPFYYVAIWKKKFNAYIKIGMFPSFKN